MLLTDSSLEGAIYGVGEETMHARYVTPVLRAILKIIQINRLNNYINNNEINIIIMLENLELIWQFRENSIF